MLQIPFFISLFYLLRSPEFKADIASNPGFRPIRQPGREVTDPVLLGVLIVLYVGTQLAASAVTAISADPTQRRIMFALPFVFVIFIVNFQAGLIVYWITTNVWTIGQQLAVKKLYPKPVPATAGGGARRRRKPARGKPPSTERRGAAAAATGRRRPREGAAGARRRTTAAPAKAPPQSPRKKKKRSERADERGARGRGARPPRARARRSARPKWAAMKELEPRFPGITADTCASRSSRRTSGDGPARVRAEVDEDAWRDGGEVDPRGARRAGARESWARIVHALGLRATVDIDETDEEIRATVNGDDLGLLIGKHGTTIDAAAAPGVPGRLRGREDRKQVTVDAAGYRERREAALHRMADRPPPRRCNTTRPVELEPMRAPERKIVHTYLSERSDVETHSEGDEPRAVARRRRAAPRAFRKRRAVCASERRSRAAAARGARRAEPDPHTTVALRRPRRCDATSRQPERAGGRRASPPRGGRRLGAGAGFPGLALAVALPGAHGRPDRVGAAARRRSCGGLQAG